jgi:hypothetical protein
MFATGCHQLGKLANNSYYPTADKDYLILFGAADLLTHVGPVAPWPCIIASAS